MSSVKWTLAGRYISTTFRHVIPTVSRRDEGLYTCQADNNLGQVARADLNVSVLHGPSVTLETVKEVKVGASLEVECEAEASPPPHTFLWSKVGEETFRQEGKYLSLENVSHTSSGQYVCSATNLLTPTHGLPTSRQGNSSIRVDVTHQPGPSSVLPLEAVGVEGQSVTLSCSSHPPGYPRPLYKWWRTDLPSEILGSSANLTLHNLLLENSGSYSCQAYNSHGRGEAGSAQLRVIQEPQVVSHLPRQMTRREGEAVSLTCQARATPRPEVHWTFDGVRIGEAESFLYSVNNTALSRAPSQPVTVISSLHFTGPGREDSQHLLPADAGRYSCVFINAAGRDESSVRLRVEHKPFITNQTTDIKVAANIGETAEMQCGVKAFPEPQFSWSRDSSLVGSLGKLMFQSDKKVSDIEFQSSFSISSIKQNSYGEYMCKASNSLGSTVHIIRLVKKSRPDPPSHVTSSGAESNSLSISWTEHFHGGLKNVTFRVQYRPQGRSFTSLSPGLTYPCYRNYNYLCEGETLFCKSLSDYRAYSAHYLSSEVSSRCQSQSLTALYFRVKAVNSLGESPWSDYVTVTTLIDTEQIPPVSGLVYHNTTNTVTFRLRSYPLPLVARIQTRAQGEAWQLVKTVPLKKEPFVFLLPRDLPVGGLRVAACLQSDPSLCGQYSRADEADMEREAVPQLSSAQGENWLVAVVVGVLLTLIASLLVLVKCCWCSSARRQQKMSAAEREKQLMMTRPDILHPIDEKMLELAQIEADSRQACAHHRSGLYMNNKRGEDSPQQSPQPSQDSVWWSKQGGGPLCECQSLPQLTHLQPQYYHSQVTVSNNCPPLSPSLQDLLYGTMPRKIIREIIV